MTSAPKHSHDVVPIKITCHKLVSDCEIDDDIEVFNCLWKRALHVVESAKNYPSSMIKYQHNFNLLVQEVLRSNPHLFTDDERVFLGIDRSLNFILSSVSIYFQLDYDIYLHILLSESFSTLSADGQRLFIRLYTRKGLSTTRICSFCILVLAFIHLLIHPIILLCSTNFTYHLNLFVYSGDRIA